jgi:hypothetical protein
VRRNKFLTDALAGETNDDFVRCRTLKHAWDPIGRGDRRPEWGTMVCLRCVFCGTLRYDRYSRLTGERLGPPAYVWPDGYRDAELHDSAWWRRQWAENIHDRGLDIEPEVVHPAKRKRARSA